MKFFARTAKRFLPPRGGSPLARRLFIAASVAAVSVLLASAAATRFGPSQEEDLCEMVGCPNKGALECAVVYLKHAAAAGDTIVCYFPRQDGPDPRRVRSIK